MKSGRPKNPSFCIGNGFFPFTTFRVRMTINAQGDELGLDAAWGD